VITISIECGETEYSTGSLPQLPGHFPAPPLSEEDSQSLTDLCIAMLTAARGEIIGLKDGDEVTAVLRDADYTHRRRFVVNGETYVLVAAAAGRGRP